MIDSEQTIAFGRLSHHAGPWSCDYFVVISVK